MPEPAASLDEIRALLAHLPGPDLEAGTAAALRERQLTKPAGALGRLEELAAWLATWQGRHPPRLDHPRTVVFAGNHGVAARGVSAYPAAVTAQMVQNFIAGGAAVNQLCRVIDADLRVYEMNLDTPTADIVEAPAMSEEECARAIAYGMMAVEPGIDALAVGEMGIGNTTVAAALCLGAVRRRRGGVDRTRHRGRRRRARTQNARPWPRRWRGTGRRRPTRSTCCAGSAGSNSPRWPGRSWRRAWAACRSCSTASRPAPPPRCCTPPTRARSTIASPAMSRPSRAPPAARADRQAAAARSRHAARRSLGRDPRADAAEGGGRLPRRHGDLRRGRGQRAGVKPISRPPPARD